MGIAREARARENGNMKPLCLFFALCLATLPAFASAEAAPEPGDASVSSVAPPAHENPDEGTEGADVVAAAPEDCRETSVAVALARVAAPDEAIALSVPLDLEERKSAMQEELEAHPDPAGAKATRARGARAAVAKSELVPRPEGTGPAKRVLGWHPYWAEDTDRDAYAWSNLTHLAFFSAEVNPTNGAFSNLHGWNTDPVVETAHSNGVKVLLTATLFGETANHKLLTNSAACNKLATNLVATVSARGGNGICIDFESVGSWSGATKALTSFMSNLVQKAHAEGLEVSICLPSVDWYADFAVGQYETLGVDYSIIMGYDYYYAGSSTPGPVAPLRSSAQWVGSNSWCSVDYSTRYYLNKITNSANLMLAVPWYGRKWRAASTNLGAKSAGSSYSSAIVYPTAASQAATYGRRWDGNSSCPWYAYTSGTNAYQCFYDDAQSLGLKFDYANERDLGGVGIWCLTHAPDSAELWNLLGEKFGPETPSGGTTNTPPSTGDAPVAEISGLSPDSFVFSWTPAEEDPSGYVLQTASSADGFSEGSWVPASTLFSNSFSSAEGWPSFTLGYSGTTNVAVSGAVWTVHYAQVRAATNTCSDPGYVYLTANSAWIQTPPIAGGTVTQVTARVRAAGNSNLSKRNAKLLASTDDGATWQLLGDCPANNYNAIVDYPFSCSLQSESGVILMVTNATDASTTNQTVLLHELTAGIATSNWVPAAGTTLPGCATNFANVSAPVWLRVRNASSTNWSEPVLADPAMVPANLAAAAASEEALDVSWDAAPGAEAYRIDVASGPYTNWTSTCPAAALGTNTFVVGEVTNTWRYTGTPSSPATSSSNLPVGPGYCAKAPFVGHYLAGVPDQAVESWDFPLYGATNATLTFSNCPWNAEQASCGVTVSTLRVWYRLDKGTWNFLGECRAAGVKDETWTNQIFRLPYLDGASLAVRIDAPFAEHTPRKDNPSSAKSIRGAGLKNIQLHFTGMEGRYFDGNRPEGYPKTVTSPSDTVEGLAPDTPYFLRVQAVGPSSRSAWLETTARTAKTVVPEDPGDETILPLRTIWDFTASEGWTAHSSGDTFTGKTNDWTLAGCYVNPTNKESGDTGLISLYTPGTTAVSPPFAGLVTQVVSVIRPYSVTSPREFTLLASTDGGETFFAIATNAPTVKENCTNTISFSPPLDGGDLGVIFCASNSGAKGTIHFRRLSIGGYTSSSSSGGGGEEPGGGDDPGGSGGKSGLAETYASQPAGALSGVVVYCSGGHGFTANANNTAWITGRGTTNGIVEDFGNLDQLNYFVLQAWKAGATVVPYRPVGHQTNEIVLDNLDTAMVPGKGQVTYGGTWYNSSQKNYYYGPGGVSVGYRYASVCATGTTAWASFRPDIPVAGEYPVYAWARHGSDRVNQLYRIHHRGGVTDVRVHHAQVGNGWVWLGNYFFDEGTAGCVNISNHAPGESADGVVIADAIRFGNGMGDISRGKAGVSGYPRELEGSKYWVQRMVLDSAGFPEGVHDSCAKDQDSNVSAPNRMAVQMCRTGDWARWRRIYVSFHSNASTSHEARGTWGLGDSRLSGTSYYQAQTNLARQIADITTADMRTDRASAALPTPWTSSKNVYCSTYGEIYNGEIYKVMDPTIDEVGFHDESRDASILRTPVAREWLARGALRGVIAHLHGWYSNSKVPLLYAPDRPEAVAASNSAPGAVTVSWRMPARDAASGGEPDGFTLYTSSDGLAFGNPLSVPGGTAASCVVTGLAANATVYFRVCATNAGGESLDSPVAGVRVAPAGQGADVLVVDGFDRNDNTLAPQVHFANNVNGNVTLVRPRMINSFDYVKEHGAALAACGRSFDSLHHSRLDAATLARYSKVVWCLGEESTADETFSAAEQALVENYLANGGRLFVSGSEIGWDLGHKGSASDKAFLTNVLRAAYFQDSGGTSRATASTGGIFTNVPQIAFNWTNAPDGIYAANSPDVFTPVNGSAYAASYGTDPNGANGAAIQYADGTCKVLVMGIPFETISTAARRAEVMARAMDWFDGAEEPLGPPVGAIRVVIDPEEVRADARWTLDGGDTWLPSGETATNLPSGDYALEFSALDGWVAPETDPVSVAAGETNEISVAYTAVLPPAPLLGSLKVVINPEDVRDEARWTLDDGGTWRESGETVGDLPAGGYGIAFKPLVGWFTPEAETAAVEPDALAEIAATYTAAPQPVLESAALVVEGGTATLAVDALDVPNATTYIIETTEDLADTNGWREIATFTGTPVTFELTNAPSRLFYRLRAE
jgi:spore germination protein YaaH